APVAGTKRVGRVFDEHRPALISDGPELVHIARQPAVMDAYDGASARCDASSNIRRADVQRLRLDIGKHDLDAHVEKRDVRGGTRKDRRDDLVALAYSGQDICEMQRVSSRPHSDRRPATGKLLTELLLEQLHSWPLSEPAAAQNLCNALCRMRWHVWMKEHNLASGRLHKWKFVHPSFARQWVRISGTRGAMCHVITVSSNTSPHYKHIKNL